MKTLASLALASLFLIGCRSKPPAAEAPRPSSPQGPPCICGTPEAAVTVCIHPICADGGSNPDNPECACGTLDISDE